MHESIATTLPYYIDMIEVHHTLHEVPKADEHIFAGCFNLAPFVPATSPLGPTDWLAFSFVVASCLLAPGLQEAMTKEKASQSVGPGGEVAGTKGARLKQPAKICSSAFGTS